MKRAAVLAVLVSVTSMLAVVVGENPSAAADPDGLIVHEWGTFTTVAGADGRAVDWLPLGGRQDLPCFVERYRGGSPIKGLAGTSTPLTYDEARTRLLGKVRMETPVVYFYSPVRVSADVQVRFPNGAITEWYPRAKLTQPSLTAASLTSGGHASRLEWRGVTLTPSTEARFPREPGESHYYAARDTDASALEVNGQREKFLFYRGVGSFDVPLAAAARTDGGVTISNLGARPLRGVILFQNVDGRAGFRVHGTLAGKSSATLAAPQADRGRAAVRSELERFLTDAGLFPREARAMIATWRDSWFEEGTRVFSVLPPEDVDEILPLAIDPQPVRVARAFVGRMEVITPRLLESVRRAAEVDDRGALARHGRFLGPIVDRFVHVEPPALQARVRNVANEALAAYAGEARRCR